MGLLYLFMSESPSVDAVFLIFLATYYSRITLQFHTMLSELLNEFVGGTVNICIIKTLYIL